MWRRRSAWKPPMSKAMGRGKVVTGSINLSILSVGAAWARIGCSWLAGVDGKAVPVEERNRFEAVGRCDEVFESQDGILAVLFCH